MSTHAKLSPSGAHRWTRCLGAPAAEAPYPRTSSKYAAEGTAAHEVAALVLDGKPWPASVEVEGETHEVTPEMRRYVEEYIEALHELSEGAEIRFVEKAVPIGHITGEDGATGTADFVAVIPSRHVVQVHDLKYGKGRQVEAEGNEQLAMYALGVLEDLEPFVEFDDNWTVEMFIHQVRLDWLPSWSLPLPQLREMGLWLSERAGLARAEDAPRTPGAKQCQWCAHKADCAELQASVVESVADQFPEVEDGEHAELRRALEAVDLVKTWLASIEARALDVLESGADLPGWKLVEGRSSRVWSSEESVAKKAARAKLKIDAYKPRALLSVAQFEKLVGKKEFAGRFGELVTRKPGKPTVARESDKRSALDVADALGFESET